MVKPDQHQYDIETTDNYDDDNRRPPGGSGGAAVGVGKEKKRVPVAPFDWNPLRAVLSPV